MVREPSFVPETEAVKEARVLVAGEGVGVSDAELEDAEFAEVEGLSEVFGSRERRGELLLVRL